METRWQFLVNAVEAAIRKDGNHVAAGKLGRDSLDDCIGIFRSSSAGVPQFDIERVHNVLGMEPFPIGNALLLVDACQHHAIGQSQARYQVSFEYFAAQRCSSEVRGSPIAVPWDKRNEVPEAISRIAVGW